MKLERNINIDCLKTICMIFIIIAHCPWSDEMRTSFLFPFWIDQAVPILMIIQGFVTTKSIINNGVQSLWTAYRWQRMVKSLLRFISPMCLCFLCEILIQGLFFNQIAMRRFFWNHSLLAFLGGGYGPGSFYFIIMIQFVFVFPLVLELVRIFKEKALILLFFFNLGYEVFKNICGMTNACYRLILCRYLFAIAVGVYSAYYYNNCIDTKVAIFDIKNKVNMFILSACTTILGVIYIILVCYSTYTIVLFTYWTDTSMMSILYIAPFIVWICIKGEYQSTCYFGEKIMAFGKIVSKSSFNIFLVQKVWFGYVVELGILNNPFFCTFLSLIICISVGILFYYIENPITKYLTFLFTNKYYKLYTNS